ncbi:MAG: hypothetical protein M3Q07_18500 [Pseudobdellovibrionaceae bacterium]|nr:hypothetical protein [Pseudobdellovibrionaceae bacterium]
MLSQISNPQRIMSLRYSASNITELKGAEVLTGLEILNLSGNRIADLDLVASLRLLALTVSGNPLTNVKPLLAMKTLQKLDISNTQVHDLGALRMLPLKSLFARRIPLGTTIQKTSNNCPTEPGTALPSVFAEVLNRWTKGKVGSVANISEAEVSF